VGSVAEWSALTPVLTGDSVTLSWPQLARLVGGLPDSATKYRAWWSGNRPHVRVWRDAGYTLAHLDPGTSVTFVRAPRSAPTAPRPLLEVPGRTNADLILVACAKSKLGKPASARDLYTSPTFIKSRRYAEAMGAPWFILSAEYGLLSPDQFVAPYDRYLPDMPGGYREAWGRWTVERLLLLAGPLEAQVVEVHAGAAYVDAIAPHLMAKGAHLVEPLKGLRQGERAAWYDSRPAPDAPQPLDLDVVSSVERLLDVEEAMAPADFLASNGVGYKTSGLYGWSVDSTGAGDLSRGLGLPVTAGLIYAGLAGATRWPSGVASTNNLWARIATMHLGGNHEFSTFRRTLGAILAAGEGRDHIDEAHLTAWMTSHLNILAVPYADADALGRLEELVLQRINPPFNLKGMPATPIRARIAELRRVHRT
jgi:hypothetical protein